MTLRRAWPWHAVHGTDNRYRWESDSLAQLLLSQHCGKAAQHTATVVATAPPHREAVRHVRLVLLMAAVVLKALTILRDLIAETWKEDPEKAVKLQMAALMKQKGIEKQLQKRPSRNLIGRYRHFTKGR